MKKTILAVAALVAVGMTSCNNDEELLQGNEAIGFSNVFVDNSTRSKSDPSYTNSNLFEDFAVYGFVENATLFNGNKVTGSGVNGNWTYEGTQYWIAGAKYNFAAIAPKTNDGWTNATCTLNKDGKVETTLSFTNNGKTDLLYSNPTAIEGKDSGNDKVAFTFRHLLSKVKFSFTNNYNASNATIRVRDIEINNAYSKGDVTLTSAATTWSNQSDNKLVLSFGNAATGAVNAKEDFECGVTVESYNELLLIPGAATPLEDDQNAGYKVTFIVDLLISGTLVKEYEHTAYVNHEFVAGHSYDIVAEIAAKNIDPEVVQKPIEFTVTEVNGWTPQTQDPSLPLD